MRTPAREHAPKPAPLVIGGGFETYTLSTSAGFLFIQITWLCLRKCHSVLTPLSSVKKYERFSFKRQQINEPRHSHRTNRPGSALRLRLEIEAASSAAAAKILESHLENSRILVRSVFVCRRARYPPRRRRYSRRWRRRGSRRGATKETTPPQSKNLPRRVIESNETASAPTRPISITAKQAPQICAMGNRTPYTRAD